MVRGQPGQTDPGFLIYFLDDNAYGREEDKSFWVTGESRAEILIKADRPMKRLMLTLTAGPLRPTSTHRVGGRRQRIDAPGREIAAGSVHASTAGFWYQARASVWMVSVSEQHRVRADLPRGADRHALPRRAREAARSVRMSRIAVVTSSPPMAEGGHMVIARALVAGAARGGTRRRDRRHAAEPASAGRRRPIWRPG